MINTIIAANNATLLERDSSALGDGYSITDTMQRLKDTRMYASVFVSDASEY